MENESMWLNGLLPATADSNEKIFFPSIYDELKTNEAILLCKTASVRKRIAAIELIKYKEAHTIIEMNYYPARFNKRINFYDRVYARKSLLDLPFRAEDFEKVVFLDDIL